MSISPRHRAGVLAVITSAAVVVIAGLSLVVPARAGAAVSAGPASKAPVPANFSRVPASWHGYAPSAMTPGTYCSNSVAIFNKNSGKVLEVYNSATTNGAEVDQWSYNRTQTQHWCFFTLGYWNNSTPIYEIINNNSGKCLDLTNDNLADGQHLQQWACNGKEQQQWLWSNYGSYDIIAPYTAANNHLGYLYLMEVYKSSTANGAEVDIWTNDGTATQKWCPGRACS
jgi:hypothetical protein